MFETRDPARRAWKQWTPELTRTVVDVPDVGVMESWEEVTNVDGELVTFRSMTTFPRDDVLESMSTLRFRDRSEIESSLVRDGFDVREVRDASDRPGREMVFLARRRPGSTVTVEASSSGRKRTSRGGSPVASAARRSRWRRSATSPTGGGRTASTRPGDHTRGSRTQRSSTSSGFVTRSGTSHRCWFSPTPWPPCAPTRLGREPRRQGPSA